jgi:ABC-type dipeptide/oligopeptide/nickel transport system permease subunit
MTLTLGYSLIDFAALAFLGVGAPQDQPDWGVMVAGGQTSIIAGEPRESLIGAVLLFLTVLSFSTLGERLGGTRGRVRQR